MGKNVALDSRVRLRIKFDSPSRPGIKSMEPENSLWVESDRTESAHKYARLRSVGIESSLLLESDLSRLNDAVIFAMVDRGKAHA